MIRVTLAALASLAVTACGYSSAIDIAPFADRPRAAIMPDGDYCNVSAEDGPQMVISSEGCLRLTWKARTRQIHVVDLSKEADEEREGDFSVVKLADNLFAIEFMGEDKRYAIFPFIVTGAALHAPPIPSDKELKAVAARHPGLVMVDPNEGQPPRPPNELPLFPNQVYISKGPAAEVRAYLRDAVGVGLRNRDKDEELVFGARDASGAPDHPPTPAQLRDIVAVQAAMARLAQ